jgi:hypothetical protein
MNWPSFDREDIVAFYGRHELGPEGKPTAAWEARNLVLIPSPFTLRLSWDPDVTVTRLRCHRKVADSLKRVLSSIWMHYGQDQERIAEARVDLFGGCYEHRRVSGSSWLSLHSWGAGIDLDPERNPLGKEWAPNAGMMPEVVIDAFKAEGWTWGGDFQRPDPMHFEAVSHIAVGAGTGPPSGAAAESPFSSGKPATAAPSPTATTSDELGDRVLATRSLPPLDRVAGPDGSYTQLHSDVAYTMARKLAAGGSFDDLDFSVQDRIRKQFPTAAVYAMRQLVMDTAAAAGIMGTAEAFGYFLRVHGDPFQLLEAELRKFILEWKVAPR